MPSCITRSYSKAPELLVPPKVFLVDQPSVSYPADIWTLACTIWSTIGQRPLFEGWNTSADCIIKEHVVVSGKLPPEWWKNWSVRAKWFNEQGSRVDGEIGRSLVERFEYCVQEPRREYDMDVVEEVEKSALFAMLKGMLTFGPGERSTAEEVMHSEWMTKLGLPALQKMKADM